VLPSILKNTSSYGFNPNLSLRDPSDASKGRQKMIVEFSSPNIAKPFHAGHLRSTIIGGFLANLYEGAGWDVTRMNYLGDWGKQFGVLALGFEKYGSEEELVKNPIGHLFDVYVKISREQKEEADKVAGPQEQLDLLQQYPSMEENLRKKEAALQKSIDSKGKEKDIEKMKVDIDALKTKMALLKIKADDVPDLRARIAKELEGGVDEQARAYFKRMVDGDPHALGLWTRFRNLSIEKYKATYGRLNIHYDDYSGESQVKDESMDEAARIFAEKKISEESEGAVIVNLEKYDKKLGRAIVKKKDGTSLYLTRDVGAIKERYDKYHFDRMIYVVASQQELHLKQLFKITEVMGRKDIADRCQHITFGMVLGMSTRKGTVKFLDDILRDVGDKMHEVMQKNEDKYKQVEDPTKTADILGISAVMVQDMTGKRINNYDFDMERMCSFEGDTGPYLQYAHARLCSIMRRAKLTDADLLSQDLDFSLLKEKHAVDLIRALAQWPDVFLNTLKTQEPVTVLTYLFKMTHALSSSYDHLQVVGSEERLMRARCALYASARWVLGNGMRVLGLTPLERYVVLF